MNTHQFAERLDEVETVAMTGRVRRILPTAIEADGPNAPIGTLCTVETPAGAPLLAEIAQVDRRSVVLVPLGDGTDVLSGACVTAWSRRGEVAVGDGFLGRAIDPLARPIDGGGSIARGPQRPLRPAPAQPLDRASPTRILETGVRAIDGLLTLGHGQRIGIFAASGVGKTSLMSQITGQVDADICVLCLVGERGREIEALWSGGLTAEARARSTLVAAASDQSAALRVRAADHALALAEYWRDQGKDVLFVLDSVTRLAMAMREIGLAAGEPPTVRAYTPSVFSQIPKLVERCGALKTGGSITAVMTVLSETDDIDDPVSEMMKSLLDGHILLSRALAAEGHYPAIDVPASVSRQSCALIDADHGAYAARLRGWLGRFDSARTLIETGVYRAGGDADIDLAVEKRPALLEFLRQMPAEQTAFRDTLDRMAALARGAST